MKLSSKQKKEITNAVFSCLWQLRLSVRHRFLRGKYDLKDEVSSAITAAEFPISQAIYRALDKNYSPIR